MKDIICKIGALIFGIIYSVKGLIHHDQDVASDYYAMSMLFLLVSFFVRKG